MANDLLDSNAPLFHRLGFLAALGAGAGLMTINDSKDQMSFLQQAAVIVGSAVLVVAIGLPLILRDRTNKRLEQGVEISKAEKLLFTPGCFAVTFWLVVGIVVLSILFFVIVLLAI